MTRLTTALRETILEAAMDAAPFKSRQLKLEASNITLVDELYIHLLGGQPNLDKLNEFAEAYEKIKKEPLISSAIDQHSGIYKNHQLHFLINGQRHALHFSGFIGSDGSKLKQPKWISKLAPPSRLSCVELNLKEISLIKRVSLANKAWGKLIDDRKHLTRQVGVLLASVNTVKQLISVWPESKELIPKDEKPKAALPMVQIRDLNTLIGLPTDTKARN